jgi:hemoglobin
MNKTLYEKIGGKKTVEKAAHFLYVNILKDDRINIFFKDIDIEKQKRKMTAFLNYIFGGPSLYIGKDMRRAHENVVAKGLSDEHVDAMMECVSKALTEIDIDKETIGEVIKTIEAHRDDVLNR